MRRDEQGYREELPRSRMTRLPMSKVVVGVMIGCGEPRMDDDVPNNPGMGLVNRIWDGESFMCKTTFELIFVRCRMYCCCHVGFRVADRYFGAST